ncbi:hypothetical protein AC579_6640 [Pseudocercospora musae]|uniref:Uncharacterized protein n=1 Tax=Pseudocercospora musae TaxID=113226 RepID=A0A139IP95_9PEZI|nr:hypothetical protein AC579_6640 [Pseudocercospora musae]
MYTIEAVTSYTSNKTHRARHSFKNMSRVLSRYHGPRISTLGGYGAASGGHLQLGNIMDDAANRRVPAKVNQVFLPALRRLLNLHTYFASQPLPLLLSLSKHDSSTTIHYRFRSNSGICSPNSLGRDSSAKCSGLTPTLTTIAYSDSQINWHLNGALISYDGQNNDELYFLIDKFSDQSTTVANHLHACLHERVKKWQKYNKAIRRLQTRDQRLARAHTPDWNYENRERVADLTGEEALVASRDIVERIAE